MVQLQKWTDKVEGKIVQSEARQWGGGVKDNFRF